MPNDKLKVLLIGDHIDDVYQEGEVIGMANEDPVPKMRIHSTSISPGGISFCANLFRSLIPDSEVHVVKTTESTIVRFIDTTSRRNLLTLDQYDPALLEDYKKSYSIGMDMFNILDSQEWDLVYFWSDRDILTHLWSEMVISHMMDSQKDFSQTMTAGDMSKTSSSLNPDYMKQYIGEDKVFTAYTMQTGRDMVKVMHNSWSKAYKNPELPYLVDPCGAGDTMFITSLISLWKQGVLTSPIFKATDLAIQMAQAAAQIQCMNLKTYLPTWKEVEQRHEELYGPPEHH